MTLLEPKLGKAGVHHRRKSINSIFGRGARATFLRAYMPRNSHGRVVAGGEHKPVEEVTNRLLLAALQPHLRPTNHIFGGNSDNLVELAAFHGEDSREDFGGAGRGQLLVRAFLVNNLAGWVFHHDGGFGAYLRLGGRLGRGGGKSGRRGSRHKQK